MEITQEWINKEPFLHFLENNYDSIVVNAIGGEYIEIDLKSFLDIVSILAYPFLNTGDGLREGRYLYYMKVSTKIILTDLIQYQREKNINKIYE